MKKLPIAIQVYSIREEAEKDFFKTMKDIKSMGYDGVELAGLYGHQPEEIRDSLKEIGLTPISAHVSYEEFMQDLSGTVKSYAIIGCRFLAIPYLIEEKRYGSENYDRFIKDISLIAKECRKEGITLLYHNHDFEFLTTECGDYALDAMYEQISKEDLQAELDLCWVKVAGEEPTDYIKKYAGRCPILHIKDLKGIPFQEFAAVGYGIQDIGGILEEAKAAQVEWLVVEQDEHTDHSAMEDARLSIEYLLQLKGESNEAD